MSHPYSGIAALGNIKAKAEIHSFADAENYLNGNPFKHLASNITLVRRGPDAISVQLYDTYIITYYKDNTFIFDNGGFSTVTTKNRVQQFSPNGWRFFHHQFILYGKKDGCDYPMGERIPV